MTHKIVKPLIAVAMLSACGAPAAMTQLGTARGALANAKAGPAIVETDLSKSCAELTTMASTLYTRHEEIVSAANARQTRNSLVGGLVSTGIGIVGGNAMLGAGSLSGMRVAQGATVAAQTLSDGALLSGNPTSLKEINDVTTITARTAQIERAKLQKGC